MAKHKRSSSRRSRSRSMFSKSTEKQLLMAGALGAIGAVVFFLNRSLSQRDTEREEKMTAAEAADREISRQKARLRSSVAAAQSRMNAVYDRAEQYISDEDRESLFKDFKPLGDRKPVSESLVSSRGLGIGMVAPNMLEGCVGDFANIALSRCTDF